VGSGRVELAGDESRFVNTIQSVYNKLCLGVATVHIDHCSVRMVSRRTRTVTVAWEQPTP